MAMDLLDIGKNAKAASRTLIDISTEEKNKVLLCMADTLRAHTDEILEANAVDMAQARANNMREGLLDRLYLDEKRVAGICDGLAHVASLEDPVGKIGAFTRNKAGLQIARMSVPMGVIAMIYEGRPNVTVDAAGLCLKSGNAVILRGSKSIINTSTCMVNLMRKALSDCGMDANVIQLVTNTDHQVVQELIRMNGYVDLAIPRGGANLIQAVVKNATVPVIETGTGNCHIFVDSSADIDMAVRILINGKTQRVGVCNALESIVVCQDVAEAFLQKAVLALEEKNVIIYGCQKTRAIVDCQAATEEDFGREYGDYKISCKVVKDIDEAIAHINHYSTGHSECIITNDYDHATRFLKQIDSACVYVNASTRFSDGGEFGFGAEIGISTQKMHARGPMGLEALTSYKYIVLGQGQVRA
jgi:glutamate-5-semialdehyde dehydrogenase